MPVRGDLALFPSGELLQFGAAAAESQLAVEPEGSGVEGFVVVLSDLIRIDGDRGRTREGAETAQRLRINPGSFALTISVKSVETDLDPFAEAHGFDVINGNAILERESRNVRAQRQSTRRRQIPEIHDDASTSLAGSKIGADDRARSAQCRAVEFAVAHRHHFPDGVQDELAFTGRKFREPRSGFRELVRERNLTAHDQRLSVIVELARTIPIACARKF